MRRLSASPHCLNWNWRNLGRLRHALVVVAQSFAVVLAQQGDRSNSLSSTEAAESSDRRRTVESPSDNAGTSITIQWWRPHDDFVAEGRAAHAAPLLDRYCLVGGDLTTGIAKPFISRAADRPLITHGVQSGDVSIGSGVVWARADRPARMLVEVSTTDSFKIIRNAVFVDALPETDFTAKALLEGLPPGQDIFYRISFQDHASPNIIGETPGRSLPHRAERPALRFVSLVGRYRGAGLGHRRNARRHADLCGDARQSSGFLHPFGRQHLCRLPDSGAAEAAERPDLEKHRHRGEIQGRRNARRVSRQLQIQSARPQCARLQRRGADLRAMGRSRDHQRLVAGRSLRIGRLCGEEHPHAGGARQPRLPRIHADARGGRRKPGASIARSPMGRCSTCSCSTCAPTAPRTPRATSR